MLRSITLDEVVEVTGGALVDGPEMGDKSGEEVCTSVSTDSRTVQKDALFVALKGENFDAHDFVVTAQEKGAAALLVDRALHLSEIHLPHVVVPDTLHAFGDIARYSRDDFKGPVVGVTGSVGKTTTKELLAIVLETNFSVLKSAANFNNDVGVPQTIFQLEPTHTAAVLEMGMRGPGQIRRLCEIAAPTIGVITNIGQSHIELLGSQENIALAKAELFDMLPSEGGLAVYPATDAFAETLKAHYKGKDALTVALDAPADVQATEIVLHENGYRFTVNSPWGTTKMFLPSPGRFNVQNALLAIAVAGHLGVSIDAIAKALLRWTPPPMRLEPLKTPNGITILSDAYNAAPDSMKGALETLRDTPTGPGCKKIAVLGDMKELGQYADEAHTLIGRALAQIAPDMLILIGELTKKTAAGALGMGYPLDHLHQFETTAEAVSLLPMVVQPGDVVLVKGSRAMGLERIVEALGGPPAPEAEQSVGAGLALALSTDELPPLTATEEGRGQAPPLPHSASSASLPSVGEAASQGIGAYLELDDDRPAGDAAK